MLAAGNRTKIALFAVAVGLGWGWWAGWWPAELGSANTSLAAFAGHTLACTILLIGAWLVLGGAGSEWIRPAKYELAVLLAIVAMFFFAVRVPATPRSALILPPLLLACAWGLRRNQSQEVRSTASASNHGNPLLRASLLPVGLTFSIGNITPGPEESAH